MNIRAVLNNTRFWCAVYTRPRTCVLTEAHVHKGENERWGGRERRGLPHATLPVAWITLISPLCPTSSIRLPDVDKELTALQDVLRKYGNAVASEVDQIAPDINKTSVSSGHKGSYFFFSSRDIALIF